MSRTPEEFARIYGTEEYRAWGYALPCLVEGCETRDRRPGTGRRMECCHTTTGGMGRKADAELHPH